MVAHVLAHGWSSSRFKFHFAGIQEEEISAERWCSHQGQPGDWTRGGRWFSAWWSCLPSPQGSTAWVEWHSDLAKGLPGFVTAMQGCRTGCQCHDGRSANTNSDCRCSPILQAELHFQNPGCVFPGCRHMPISRPCCTYWGYEVVWCLRLVLGMLDAEA